MQAQGWQALRVEQEISDRSLCVTCIIKSCNAFCAVPNGPKTLDFAGVSTILNIMGNGTMEIIGINIRGIASRHLLGATVVPNLRAVGFAFWPTITAQPGAKVNSKCAKVLLSWKDHE